MERPRAELSATEVEELYARIEEKLKTIGLVTQPKVASQILELVQNPDVTVVDFAGVIRTDWNTAGRVLKLANSAYFAQRTTVTALERALVLLGLERVKSIALGVYLSRAAAGSRETTKSTLSREVWGQSVYRACLAGRLATIAGHGGVSEAFVTGLMLDCGIPLMVGIVGEQYTEVYKSAPTPTDLYAAEMREYFCTHVDVATVLMRTWKIPMTLAKPISWHHAPMPASASADTAVALRRIACCVGAIKPAPTEIVAELADCATAALGVSADSMVHAITDAGREYAAMMQLFGEIATPVRSVETLAEAVHTQLLRTMDEQTTHAPASAYSARMKIGVNDIVLERQADGRAKATIYTTSNEPLLTIVVRADENPKTLLSGLGIEHPTDAELAAVARTIPELKVPPRTALSAGAPPSQKAA